LNFLLCNSLFDSRILTVISVHYGQLFLLDYLERELETGACVVHENEQFAAIVPFWVVWPFEAMIIPKTHVTSLASFSAGLVQV
jgi:galactose-1-phosphate uridylyltransferase